MFPLFNFITLSKLRGSVINGTVNLLLCSDASNEIFDHLKILFLEMKFLDAF